MKRPQQIKNAIYCWYLLEDQVDSTKGVSVCVTLLGHYNTYALQQTDCPIFHLLYQREYLLCGQLLTWSV